MLLLILRTLYKTPEIEYLHYTIQIVNHAILHKELRTVLHTDVLDPSKDSKEDKQAPLTYVIYLKNNIEKTNEVISITKLHQKVVR